MPSPRTVATVAGALYLVTIATSIPALALKAPFLDGAAGASSDAVLWAAILELALALNCIGTAVVLYPVVRRTDPVLALSFVASRTLEAAIIMIGIIAMLTLVSVRASGVGGAGDTGVPDALTAMHDWAFLLGPGVMPAVNALLLGTALLRSRLVPRIIPLVGLVGAPLLLLAAGGTTFGLFDQVSPVSAVAAVPIALWELSLGMWLVVKGFRPAALDGPHEVSSPRSRTVA
ncbi:DUF4386 domain-containing protein [Sanguibacter sp. 25GB23B1]|uniref:DUF4386 domain-containing protein n=1 Tax=unclassified Sanguibacter TaxID=2645534 RepID=UPI0032AF8F05